MISQLNLFFNDKVILKKNNNNNNRFFSIFEDSTGSKIKKLNINNIPDESMAIFLDPPMQRIKKKDKPKFSVLNHYVNDGHPSGVNKRCDAVIFFYDSEKKVLKVILFELKSSNPDFFKLSKQLLNSEMYIKYLMSIAGEFIDDCFKCIEYLKVVVKTGVKKRVTSNDDEEVKKIKEIKKILNNNNINCIELPKLNGVNGDIEFNQLI